MFYEVFIPSPDPNGFDVTITVEATNWMVALKSGLQRTGEPNADIRNVMCDIKEDNSIHVTDALTRRVFVLRELAQEEVLADPTPSAEILLDQPVELTPEAPAEQVVVAPEPEPTPVAPSVEPAVEQAPRDVAPNTSTPSGEQPWLAADGRVRIGSSNYEAQRRDSAEHSRVVRETRRRSGSRPALQLDRQPSQGISESILEDIFLEIQAIHEGEMPMEDALNFIMDMSMQKIPAESGAILFADVNGQELYFATARGPKSSDVMNFRVPMSQGIVGFCSREGVSLAISDAQRDARFYRKISEALGYPNKSLICAPIQFDGRVYGCIELLNRQAGSSFDVNEANALNYIGNQFGQYINNLIMSREKI
jgi:hypothetical protein